MSRESLHERVERFFSQRRVSVPVSVFATSLSPAEALVKHLKEQENLTLAEISRLTNRDQRGIWSTYRRAKNKRSQTLTPSQPTHLIPAKVFSDRSLSILEHAAHYLRCQRLPIKKIALLLNKKPGTIAAVLHRARRKLS